MTKTISCKDAGKDCNWSASATVQRFPILATLPPEQLVNKSNKVIIDNVFIV